MGLTGTPHGWLPMGTVAMTVMGLSSAGRTWQDLESRSTDASTRPF